MASYLLASQLSGQSDTSGSTSFDFQTQWEWCHTDSSGSRCSASQQSEEFRSSSSAAACAFLKGQESAARCVATLEGPHGGNVVSLALSGDLLYAGSDASDIRVWRHSQAGEEGAEVFPVATRFRLRADGGAVKALVVVKDRLYSAHQDRKLRVWNKPAPPLDPHKGVPAEALEEKHKPVATLPTVKDYVVSFLPPYNYVHVRRHHKALWIQHADTISVLVAGAGVLYSGSWDKSIKVWRLSDHKCLESLAAHDDAVNALVVDQANAFLYSGGADAKVKVWARILPDGSYITATATPLTTPRQQQHQENLGSSPPRLLRSQASAANLLSPSLMFNQQLQHQQPARKGSYMSSPADPRLLHNRHKSSYGRKHHHHFKGTSPLHPHASNQHGSHLLVATLEGHGSAINALALSPDGSLLYSASADCTISVWEREDSARHMTFATVLRGHQQSVLCLAVSTPYQEHNNHLLCSGSADSSIRVWRCAASRSLRHVCVALLQGHRGPVRSLALRDDAAGIYLYSGGMDRGIKVWWLPCSHQQQKQQQQPQSRNAPSPAFQPRPSCR